MKLLLLLPLLLIGCAPTQSIIKPEIVEVNKPIYICPAPPIVPPSTFLTSSLVDKDAEDPGKVAQYYASDILMCKDKIKQYESVLDTYRKMK